MKGVYTDVVIDPPPNEILYLEEGSQNVELRNLDLHGWTFFVRSSTDILIEGGSVGDTTQGENCKIGGAYKTTKICERVTVRDIHFHDMITKNASQHHEALFICDIDGVLVENCVFENIWANTADLFFTAEQTKQLATNVVVRGNHFMAPMSPGSKSAMQFGDKKKDNPTVLAGMKPIANYLIEGNLFDGANPTFGTILRPVTNFHVGINYGMCSQNQYDYAVKMGITFEEYPFRPAEEWPGPVGVTPPAITLPPGVDPCADVKDELALANERIVILEGRIDQAIQILSGP